LHQETVSKYLQPEVLTKLSNLQLIARLVVEGFLTGLHKSPFHGFSVEFSQHRAYMPGDNLRFLDWKVLARTGRHYIKQYEEETNLRSYILLDTSKSMLYGSGNVSKARYASYLAAALFYLLMQQRDASGLVLFDEKVRKILPPKGVFSYLPVLLQAIDSAQYGEDTKISTALHAVAELFKRRGLIILISDLLDTPQDILAGLKHFRHDRHEILVFHIMDKQEVDFDFKGEVVFEDLESGQRLKTQPGYIRSEYRKHIEEYLNYLNVECGRNRISYQPLTTDTPFDVALTEFLLKRKRLI